jgi:hypothetical protein
VDCEIKFTSFSPYEYTAGLPKSFVPPPRASLTASAPVVDPGWQDAPSLANRPVLRVLRVLRVLLALLALLVRVARCPGLRSDPQQRELGQATTDIILPFLALNRLLFRTPHPLLDGVSRYIRICQPKSDALYSFSSHCRPCQTVPDRRRSTVARLPG